MLGCILNLRLEGKFLAEENDAEEIQTDDVQKATQRSLAITLFSSEEPHQTLLHNKIWKHS